jgi:predicted nucleotide-binding protein
MACKERFDDYHRVLFGWQSGVEITTFPPDADEGWLQTPLFRARFGAWLRHLQQRRDVFLGCCSSAADTARDTRQVLETLGVTVLDWADFAPARSILAEIEEAASRCSAAVFLFTKDDPLQGEQDRAAPRDNVVFEAGYFAQAKGKDRVLIVREEGSKMPADLGGDIYASLGTRGDIEPIRDTLERFVFSRL